MNSFKRLFCAFAALCLANAAQAGGFDDGMAAFDKGDFKGAYAQWLPLAENGDARAQGWLGRLYIMGLGVERNEATGLEWFRKSASQNDAVGQAGLGVMYLAGRGGVVRNSGEGIRWMQKAADGGVASAQFSLAVLFFLGKELPQDPERAKLYFAKAAKGLVREAQQGHLDGKTLVAGFFLYGPPVKVGVDANQALAWLTEAAERGYPIAQNNLGHNYLLGTLSRKDAKQAFHWFEKSAQAGYADGQFRLSEFYGNGQVVEQNDVLAVEWLKKAAERGHVVAQFLLGTRYREGNGVPQDDALAVHWLEKAAAQGAAPAHRELEEIRAQKNQ